MEPIDSAGRFCQKNYDYVERKITECGYKGILFTPPYGQFHSNDRAMYPFYELANAKGAVVQYHHSAAGGPTVLAHTKFAKMENLNDVTFDFPDMHIVVEHIGYPFSEYLFIMMVNDDIIKSCVGPNYRKFAPYLLTAFFFIFINNMMGLIPFFPGGANVTGNIAVTMVLAICTFLAVNIFGTKHYWKDIFWPDVPWWLKVPVPMMPFIEFFGIFTKPFALMIRLFANMLAGHMAMLVLTCLIFISASMGPALNGTLTVASVLFNIFMNALELLVAFIQAYVFTMLSAVFIGLAQEGAKVKAADK